MFWVFFRIILIMIFVSKYFILSRIVGYITSGYFLLHISEYIGPWKIISNVEFMNIKEFSCIGNQQ